MAMKFDVFLSYPRSDNARGRVTELKEEIERTYAAATGEALTVFFDSKAIRGMDDWQGRIQQAVRGSCLFVAILSPAYLRSKWCRAEWEDYLRYEAMRQCLGEGAAPVLFVTLPDPRSGEIDDATAAWMAEIRRRQTVDLRPWRRQGRGALRDATVRTAVDGLGATLRERLDRAERGRRSPSNLLPHNPLFVGRLTELRELRQVLADNKLGVIGATGGHGASRAAVQGLGGMGKTELALAYAHAFAWDYPGGRWQVPVEHTADLRLALIRLSEPMRFIYTEAEAKDPDLAFARVRHELARRGRCLLLLDNVSDQRLLEPAFLDALPRGGPVDLIATTRLPPAQIPGSAQNLAFVSVDELPEADAFALMQSHQPQRRFASVQEAVAAREIVRQLDRFTLAVETAAIFLGRHPAPDACRNFLRRLQTDLLRESEAAAADPAVAVRHRERLLEKTLAITLETVTPAAAQLLSLACLLPADHVASSWLATLSGLPRNVLRKAIELLSGLRLFQATGSVDVAGPARTFRMHRLVQGLLAARLAPAIREASWAALDELIGDRVADLEQTTAWEAVRWELEPLEGLAARWADEGQTHAAWLLGKAGALWLQVAEFARAEPLLRRALEVDEAVHGPSHPDVASGLNNLAQLLKNKNRLAEAEPMMRRSLELDEVAFGADSPEAAVGQLNLGSLLHAVNRLPEAERHLRRALEIEEQHFGADSVETIQSLNNLGTLLKETHRFAEAEALFRRALGILEVHGGGGHRYYAGQLNNLAIVLYRTNRLAEAEDCYRRALALSETRFGLDHPEVAARLSNLGQLLQSTDRFEEAEKVMRRALAIVRKFHGDAHPAVATRLNNLAQLLEETGETEKAEPLLQEALEIDKAGLGPDHPSVAVRLNNLARLLHDSGRFSDAEQLFRRALKINETSFGPHDPNVARDLHNLGRLLLDTGRVGEAEAALRQALAIDEAVFGPDHPEIAVDLSGLGELLRRTGRLAEAERPFRRALEIQVKSRGESHTSVAAAASNLGLLCQDTGRWAEAEAWQWRACEIDEARHGPDHVKTGIRLHNLAMLLRETRALDRAEPLLARALLIFLRHTARTGHFRAELPAVAENFLILSGEIGCTEAALRKKVRAICRQAGLSAKQRKAIFSEEPS